MLASALRVVLVTGVLLGAYVFAPIGERPVGNVGVRLCLALVVLLAVLLWQIRAVSKSAFPTLRGVEAVAVSVPMLVVTFAATYYGMAHAVRGSFTEPLSRLDGMYFAVTVFATVGFGDIAPVTGTARLIVMLQMVFDLLLVGLIAKVLVGAVQQRRRALGHDVPR